MDSPEESASSTAWEASISGKRSGLATLGCMRYDCIFPWSGGVDNIKQYSYCNSRWITARGLCPNTGRTRSRIAPQVSHSLGSKNYNTNPVVRTLMNTSIDSQTNPLSILLVPAGEDQFVMEAFMYRCHPQIGKLVELIGDGAIGRVQVIRSTFGYGGRFNPESRGFARELGGGGIMDVGCYPASAARLVAGAAVGQPFLDPIQVKATGILGPTGVDHYTTAVLAFDNDIIAQISTAVTVNLGGDLIIHGTEGSLSLPNPWLPSSPCRPAKLPIPLDTPIPPSAIELTRHGETETIIVEADRDVFTYEADMVVDHIPDRQAPAMSWADSLGNMKTLDRWRAEIGVVYEQD